MPLIIPSADLRNNYNKISKRCHETKEQSMLLEME